MWTTNRHLGFILASLGLAPSQSQLFELETELVAETVGATEDRGETSGGEEDGANEGEEDGEGKGDAPSLFVPLVDVEDACIRAVVDGAMNTPTYQELIEALSLLGPEGKPYLTAEEFRSAVADPDAEHPLDDAELAAALSAAVNPADGRIHIESYASVLAPPSI